MKPFLLLTTILWASLCNAQSSPAARCPVPEIPATATAGKTDAPRGTADLNSVIASVTSALKCYQDNRGSGPDSLPDLQEAKFDFKTTTGKVGGVTVSFFIFKLGASKESDTTNQITFTYGSPKAKSTGQALKFAKPPQAVADAIVADMQSAAAAIKARATIDKLTFKTLTITLAYGIQFDGNVAVNAPVQLVTIGASYDAKRNDVQTLTLTFSDPNQPAKP